MVTDTAAKPAQTETSSSLADKASDLQQRAGALLQDGIDAVKAHPAATAAVVGGVAAAAAAYVGRDKIAEAATAIRDKVSEATKSDGTAANGETNA